MKKIRSYNTGYACEGSRIFFEQHFPEGEIEKIILFCHGFPGTNRLDKLVYALKDEPISIVEVNYGGDQKSQGRFSFLGSIEDIIAMTNKLDHRYPHIPIHALGYSMGGFYVSNLLNQRPTIFDKAIFLNPVVDTKTFFADKLLMDELWGYADDVLSLYEHAVYQEEIVHINKNCNPIDFAYKFEIPTSVVQSTADEVLDPAISKKFFNLLCCEKKFYEISGAKHDLAGNEKQLLRAIIE